jgi:hypothetical protein
VTDAARTTAAMSPPRGLLRAALLFAALVVGGAAQLLLTKPDWFARLEIGLHEVGVGRRPLYVAALVLEATVLIVAERRRLRGLLGSAASLLSRPSTLLGACLLAAASAHAMETLSRGYAKSFVLQAAASLALAALHLSTLAAAAAALPDRVARFFDFGADPRDPTTADAAIERRARLRSRLFAVFCAAAATASSAYLARGVLEAVPHVPDEVAYLFQAETFAGGRIDAPPSPDPEATKAYCVATEPGRTFAVTPPGWPAVLALGFLCGAPWVVNPILGGVAVLLIHALTTRLRGPRAAAFAALLVAASPWRAWLSASYMTHAASLVAACGAWLLIEVAADRRRAVPAFVAGASVGWLFLIRPLDGVLVGALLGLRALGLFGARLRAVDMIACVFGGVCVAAWIFPYNAALSGAATTPPIEPYIDALWYPGANRLGFGPDVGNPPNRWGLLDPLPGHGWRDVLYNANHNLVCLDDELFGFPGGSLWLPLLAFASCARRKGRDVRAALLWIVGLGLGYSLYWFSGGPDYGPRYWYLMFAPCASLSAAALAAPVFPRSEDDAAATDGARARLHASVVVCVVFACAVFTPWRATTKYREYRGFHGDYARLSATPDLRGALVLVETGGDGFDTEWYSARHLNDPFFDSDDPRSKDRPFFARDLGPESLAKLKAAMPERRVVRVLGRGAGRERATIAR